MASWSFEVCQVCGKHGRVLNPQGEYGLELLTQLDALMWVEMMASEFPISEQEQALLLLQIGDSALPYIDQVDWETEQVVRKWNHLNIATEFVGDPARLHDTVLLLCN